MRKKTEPPTQQHPRTSRAGARNSGLIATEENTPRSVGEECVVDNRSHRTQHNMHTALATRGQHGDAHNGPFCAYGGWGQKAGR